MHQPREREQQEHRHAEEQMDLEHGIHAYQQRRIGSQVNDALHPLGQRDHDAGVALVGVAQGDRNGGKPEYQGHQ